MKYSVVAMWGLVWTSAAEATPLDPCPAAVENLTHWSQNGLTEAQQQESLRSCREAITQGEAGAENAATCLGTPEMKAAIACMTEGIISASTELCTEPPQGTSPAECRAHIDSVSEQIPGQLEALITSGQILGGSTVPEIPPAPTDPGTCTALIDNLERWSNRRSTEPEQAQTIAQCEQNLGSNSDETRVVVMCLSLPELEAASDCLVHEAIRTKIEDCKRTQSEEQSRCTKQLFDMIEPMKADLQRSIMDGSFLE